MKKQTNETDLQERIIYISEKKSGSLNVLRFAELVWDLIVAK